MWSFFNSAIVDCFVRRLQPGGGRGARNLLGGVMVILLDVKLVFLIHFFSRLS